MFNNILNKLKEAFKIEETQKQKVTQDTIKFEHTGYEIVDTENMPRMFSPDIFNEKNMLAQTQLMQERVNRLVSEYNINQPLKVEITDQAKKDVELKGNVINVNPKALEHSIVLYAQLAGITERARQIQFAKEHPDSTIGIAINNKNIQAMTGSTYDKRNITPTQGKGQLYFGPTINTDNSIYDINYNTVRKGLKIESSDYYISRLQVTERLMAIKLEKAAREMREMIEKDGISDSDTRLQLKAIEAMIGSYDDDRREYIARTGCSNPEVEIDNFVIAMHKNPNGEFTVTNDMIDTDIKMASIHAYNASHRIETSLESDPRRGIELNYTKDELKQMSDQEFIKFFYPKNWENLALEEKKMVLQEHCQRESQKLGLTRDYQVLFESIHGNMDACYVTGESKVHFKEEILASRSPLVLYGLIPHELTHAKQNEKAIGLLPATESERQYYGNLFTINKYISTPSHYHGHELTPIYDDMLRGEVSYFQMMDPARCEKLSTQAIIDGDNLYKLQPFEREAYEYQEQKGEILRQAMQQDGVLDKNAQNIFNNMEKNSIKFIERDAMRTWGCKDPTEAIRQFQLYTIGATKDYDPQSEEFDFTIRYRILSQVTFNKFGSYLPDMREAINNEEPMGVLLAQTTHDVPDRMSRIDQQYPQEFVRPLSDEIQKNEFSLDAVRKFFKVDRDFDDVEQGDNGICAGITIANETFTKEDVSFIMNALGTPPIDLDDIIQEAQSNTNTIPINTQAMEGQ